MTVSSLQLAIVNFIVSRALSQSFLLRRLSSEDVRECPRPLEAGGLR
jgi:hypothetical protein